MGIVSLLFFIEFALAELPTAPAQTTSDAATQERIDQLIEQLNDEDDKVRAAAARALGFIGDVRGCRCPDESNDMAGIQLWLWVY